MAASCLLRAVLSRTLSRSRCSGGFRWPLTSARVVPEAGRRTACWEAESRREDGTKCHRRRRGGLWAAVAFSLFRSTDEDQRDEAQRKEDDIILLLKKAKLSVHRGNLQAASSFFHQAVALAQQTHNNQAIIYTYSQMANLAYVQGHLDSAEKLFKAAMSYMLAGGTPEDDNAVIEMSLKLATIYAEQNKAELAEHGFRFCVESLEAKLEKHKKQPEDEKTGETEETEQQEALRKDTHLLLGLCLDSRARYRVSRMDLDLAGHDYRKALDICRQEQGQDHPQTLVLMSDLATILDLQGRHDDALVLIQQAVDLSVSVENPDHHVLLENLAGILLHTGRLDDSARFYQEALDRAQQAGDRAALERIQDGLEELRKRRSQTTKDEQD
ncbi:tetratricopeptide repeat protein 19, mitochondrial-like isoform X2 [Poeciliopsis prolifica]|uniref:tetratricopeptide repeat protein 19, mitochondrial-like isoform X2 n=1 Tax=Poeciliopsis prolifica TaxID=188132 RepID=UPI0024142786|nr:tetratricopeptide repeat protein 19, mitochondrial-like isoform X2 [Poeciliopsis prolifica]